MKIHVQSRGFGLTQGLRSYGERRLLFSLSRFGDHVRSVRLAFDDLNCPRGGVDKRCQVLVRLALSREVRIQQSDRDMYAAIDRAGDRVHQAVARELERCREGRPAPRVRQSMENTL